MHPTKSYFIVDAAPSVLEIWFDWIPSVDQSPHLPRTGEVLENDFVVSIETATGHLQTRAFKQVDPNLLKEFSQNQVFAVLCGPSGVLARTEIKMT